ncbi:MAG: MFS transporter [Deltaproteobacteria bacterium]|nr:MFS transporter [Deltaproteobacteria bacterium]
MIKSPRLILAFLTGLNLLNYLDRLVVSAVLPKIQDELVLSNFVGGLLATIFLIGYFVTAPAFGSLGDRVARKWLIALGVVVWSAATCASGLATSAWGLLVARAFVGIGEASYATLAPTIIDDITPPQKKGGALAVFYSATPIGAALGYLVGGFVEARWGWRAAFFVAGGPGLVLALVCLLMHEPERTVSKEKPDIKRDFGTLYGTTLYRKGVLGYCAYTAAIGAFSYWAPKFLYARYGMPLKVANFKFGVVTVVAGALATAIGGKWADRVRSKAEKSAPADVDDETVRGLLRICAIGSAIGAPLAVACFLSSSPDLFFILVFADILALFLCTSPINAVILRAVPPELRASAMALSIFAIHVLGDLWSPPLVGLLADHLPIALAMMTLPVAIGASAWLWWPRRAT